MGDGLSSGLIVDPAALHRAPDLLREPYAEWCGLVRVDPHRIQIRREKGWGYIETIEPESR